MHVLDSVSHVVSYSLHSSNYRAFSAKCVLPVREKRKIYHCRELVSAAAVSYRSHHVSHDSCTETSELSGKLENECPADRSREQTSCVYCSDSTPIDTGTTIASLVPERQIHSGCCCPVVQGK